MARPAKSPSQALRRVQMDMPERSVARLLALQDATDAASYAEVIKNALRVYEMVIREVESGGEILIRRDGEIEKLSIFAA
jgi:hypothetical protein